ncbi:MAG: isopeptide-forming domain-containing fimbrial protein [Bacillota bacterium]|nr:isopeptide-forming domain-containing fimbrial protein [Bacillota bacterium]
MLAPNSSDQMVTGNNELLKAGIYAPTTGGKFSAYFYEGNCGTLMTLYSQYSTNPSVFVNPTKTVNKAAARPGDTVTYTVKHTMGTFYKTAMTVYGKLEITDVIPENLEYVSAALTNGAGTNITGQGTLTYDESTRTLKFVMSDAWRNNISNYNGQVLKFTVTTKVMDFEGYEATAENKATLSYENNLSVDTNLVTTALAKPYMVQIVKSIPDSADQLGDGHGRPTFIFKISGKNTGYVRYASVTFGDENASAGWTFSKENGRWIARSQVLELADDEYSVAELDVSRFKMTGSSVYSSGNYRRFTFENEKDNWQYFSHKSVVINRLRGGAAGE